jgi:conjugative transfer pilus assembly protein TraH
MNLYTGGSLMMRAPGRNYPLVNAQLPSLRAGCGGIDIYGGAFSFINKQQFIALLQNIGSNAVGYAFKLALQSISPDIDKLLTELQDQMNKINAMNINSCEAAQALVNGVVGEYDSSVHERLRQHLPVPGQRVRPGRGALTCATNAPAVVKTAANSADPNVRNATFVKGNVTWLALNQVGGSISQQEKELIMSVIGTVILYAAGRRRQRRQRRAMPSPPSPACATCCSAAAPPTEGNVDVDVYVCDEPAECMNPVRTTVSVKPFTQLVSERLRRMSDNIVTRSPQTAADIGFINNTSEPVYRMLAVANAVPGSGTAETLIETYKDVIALDYAETFLSRSSPRPWAPCRRPCAAATGRAEVPRPDPQPRPAGQSPAPRGKADRLRQGALGLVDDPGPADPGAPALECHAAGGEGDAGLQRQRRPPRLLTTRAG